MITNTITKNNDRVIKQAIANLTMFGVPQTVAEKSVLNVVKSLTSTLSVGLNTGTFSEGQIRTTEVIE